MPRSYRTSHSATKGFKLENTLKSVQTMRKSLIEASRQAMLAGDELEDAALMGMPDDAIATLDVDPDLESAVAACRKISEHIKAAIDASEDAKLALRGRLAAEPDATLQPDEMPVQSYGERSSRSLKLRRQMARRRIGGY